ncbi:hypothetical protein F5882DRAFT_375186 [Hyaloscypha sp. PMI_1271]|nr:hypothetical protein F5882DRAFT_375186 [Hyaloscypha sp. PMI_1271]
MPKKKGQRSVRDRYTNLLFPETIKYKRKKASRGKKGEELRHPTPAPCRRDRKQLVIEAIPRDELLDHSFEELFAASGYTEPSKPSSLPSAEPSQLPLGTADTRLADAIESAQGTLGHRASEDLWLPSPTAGIGNRTPRHITSDLSEDGPSSPQSVIWAEQAEYNLPGIDNGTPIDFISGFREDRPLSLQPLSVVWARDTEHNPPGIAIEARNKIIQSHSTGLGHFPTEL